MKFILYAVCCLIAFPLLTAPPLPARKRRQVSPLFAAPAAVLGRRRRPGRAARSPATGARSRFAPATRQLRRQVRRRDPLDPRRRHADLRPRPRHAGSTSACIKIQPGDDASENGFDCDAHVRRRRRRQAAARPRGRHRRRPDRRRAHRPDPPALTSTGMDKESCPAIVCCGGRMDFHGAPLSRTWVKLGATAKTGDTAVDTRRAGHRLAGRRPRHRHRDHPAEQAHEDVPASVRDSTRPRNASIKAIDGDEADARRAARLRAPRRRRLPRRGRQPEPQRRRRVGRPERRARPHDVSPRLGRLDQLRRVPPPRQGRRARPLQPALPPVGDTMRGSSVIGASIWDSDNRWLTIHGTNYLVVRDCVGYQSVGHGFFLEDGTEVYNVLDRNLAVQALRGQAAAQAGAAVRQERRRRLLVGQQPEHLHPQRRRRVRRVRLPLRGHARRSDFDPTLPRPAARRHAQGGRHPHAAVRPLRGQRGPLPAAARLQPRRRRALRQAERRRRRPGREAPVRHPQLQGLERPLGVPSGVAVACCSNGLDIYNAEYGIWRPVYKRPRLSRT